MHKIQFVKMRIENNKIQCSSQLCTNDSCPHFNSCPTYQIVVQQNMTKAAFQFNLCKKLREYRRENKITRSQMAKAFGITTHQLGDYERGAVMTPKRIIELAKMIYNIEVNEDGAN